MVLLLASSVLFPHTVDSIQLWAALSCPYSVLQTLATFLPWTPALSPQLWEISELCLGFPSLCQGVETFSWQYTRDKPRAYIICFSSLRSHTPSLLEVYCLDSHCFICVIHISPRNSKWILEEVEVPILPSKIKSTIKKILNSKTYLVRGIW